MSTRAQQSASARQHQRGFSVSSILSYLSGSGDTSATPIKQIRAAPTNEDESPPRVLLPQTDLPHPSSFLFSNVVQQADNMPLCDALDKSVRDIRTTFTEQISRLVSEQGTLVKRMHNLDLLARNTLSTTDSQIKKSEREAGLLAGSEKLTILAEKTYSEVERILRLFSEIDALLPTEERISHHGSHYARLAPLVTTGETSTPVMPQNRRRVTPTPAISSLLSIQERSPVTPTAPKVLETPSPHAEAPDSPLDGSTKTRQELPTKLRLAPRKSLSNLRAPQLRTLPPLPSAQFSTVLPTVERDNMSTRSSIASRRSIFSTISYFLAGQPPRTVHNEIAGNKSPITAEETLRKISGNSSSGRRLASSSRLGPNRPS